jgi:hypothetical protein
VLTSAGAMTSEEVISGKEFFGGLGLLQRFVEGL